jgi:hypothetical protein
MAMRFGVDPWPRIEFYVRHGLVEKMPTAEQLQKASKLNIYAGGGFTERIIYYARHPLNLFPTKAKTQGLLRMDMRDGDKMTETEESQTMASEGKGNGNGSSTPEPLLDRMLKLTFQFSPARFAVQCYFIPYGWVVPWNAVSGTGLTVPLNNLISHVVHAPHPTALWDVQIIHADEGGLDQLEREIELAATGRGLKPRIYRALIQHISYYDYLRDLVPRVRRFDYPPTPPRFNPTFENLVNFLNYAITL